MISGIIQRGWLICTAVFLLCACSLKAQDSIRPVRDTLNFSGQLSAWGRYNHDAPLPVSLGGRYIPSLQYKLFFSKDRQVDFETALNGYGSLSTHPFDSTGLNGDVRLWRAWARYSGRQLEIRLGLQKINFGSATLLRPLMWFDQVDPRDPLQLTGGVWGLLGRYYFLNNANLWLWCLAGNDQGRPWDIGTTKKNIPELGGRFQTPVPKGEVALTYHFRKTDTRNNAYNVPVFAEIPEHRLGIDGKWDLLTGLWFEGCWIQKEKNLGVLTNQEIMNIGADYSFGVGSGLTLIVEQLLLSTDEKAFRFGHNYAFTGLSLSYPAGIADQLSAIGFYDWENHASYNFINWRHTFKYLELYLMAYLNPSEYNLPQQGNMGNEFAGPGFQIMLVYHH